MNFIEKLFVNNRIYNFFYRATVLGWFLRFCELQGRCLELGCGAGFTSLEITKKFSVQLTSIDIDENEIAQAKKRVGKKVKVLQADAADLPFADSTFDCVVEISSFHHIPNWEKAVYEAYRVLKKGGSFFLLDEGRYFLWPLTCIMVYDPFDGKFTKNDMKIQLEKAGFKVKKDKGRNLFMIHASK